ncbi:hypothetical protein [Candidatus Rariloculus sp.]|uniref:hypothetical protein n=1 Tax=Candidatus Rariloculus sp. TaxID=3101265 RepID=UPI003D0E8351
MNRAIVHTLVYPGILCASLVMLSPAAGAEYSWQLAGSYRQDDAPRVVESGHSSLGATYYLSPVDDEAGPYELAPFLNRSSYVTGDVARSKLREELFPAIVSVDPSTGGMLPPDVFDLFGDTGNPRLADFPMEFGIDASEYAVSGRYVWPGSGWYAGAGAERGTIDHVPQVFTEIEAQQEGSKLFAGKYFGSRTAVELGFRSTTRRETIQTHLTFSLGIPFDPVQIDTQADAEDDTKDISLSVRHVGEAGGLTWTVQASVRSSRIETRVFFADPVIVGFPEELGTPGDRIFFTSNPEFSPNEIDQSVESAGERNYTLSGALFPTDALGVRLIYSHLDRDRLGASDLIGLSATWFFVRNAAAKIELLRTDFDRGFGPGSPDRDSVRVWLLGRF